jgi:hypothetical protein
MWHIFRLFLPGIIKITGVIPTAAPLFLAGRSGGIHDGPVSEDPSTTLRFGRDDSKKDGARYAVTSYGS